MSARARGGFGARAIVGGGAKGSRGSQGRGGRALPATRPRGARARSADAARRRAELSCPSLPRARAPLSLCPPPPPRRPALERSAARGARSAPDAWRERGRERGGGARGRRFLPLSLSLLTGSPVADRAAGSAPTAKRPRLAAPRARLATGAGCAACRRGRGRGEGAGAGGAPTATEALSHPLRVQRKNRAHRLTGVAFCWAETLTAERRAAPRGARRGIALPARCASDCMMVRLVGGGGLFCGTRSVSLSEVGCAGMSRTSCCGW